MRKKLGSNQEWCLIHMQESSTGIWNNRCGWVYNGEYGTAKICDSMIPAGLVREIAPQTRNRKPFGERAYEITPLGKLRAINIKIARLARRAEVERVMND